MSKSSTSTSLQSLQLQLEEALQMLRLVAVGKRTCLEVEEWLDANYSHSMNESETLTSLLAKNTKEKK